MLAEIAEQPQRWADLVDHGKEAIDAAADMIATGRPELLAHALLGIPVALATPATTTAHGAQLRYPRSVALAVSQSGSSPDLLATVTSLRAAGVPAVAYTNQPASGLALLGDVSVDLQAGPEQSVAATKTYTAELLALGLTILRAAGAPWEDLARDTAALSRAVAESLTEQAVVLQAMKVLAGSDRVLVVGRGYSMATAREAALKFMETSSIAASGWSAADATHGPLGQVVSGTPVIALTASPAGRESVIEFARAAQSLGGTVVEIGGAFIPNTAATVAVPEVRSEFVPLAEIVPLQRIALGLSLQRGMNPDSPTGLRKVTLTT
jgi:glucosamine--fructose-6-phosphate aminotransferase (isomerizing)